MRRGAVFVCSLAWSTACTLLVSTDDLSGGAASADAGGDSRVVAEADATPDTLAPDVELDAKLDAPTDAGVLFDDFDSPTLGAGWTWVNPLNDATYSLTQAPGNLVITLPAGTTHDCFDATSSCARMMRPLANDAERTFTVTIQGKPTLKIQSYGLLIWGDVGNYLRFEVNFGAAVASGAAVSSYYNQQGTISFGPSTGALTLAPVTKLRIVRSGVQYALSYSTDQGMTWTTVSGSPVAVPMVVTQVGMIVINADANPVTSAIFDSFAID